MGRSGFLAWGKGQPARQARAREKLALVGHIREVYQDSKGTYGSPRLFKQLQENAVPCSENHVARLMRQHGLRGIGQPRYVVTTQSHPDFPVAPNVLQRRFDVGVIAQPDRVWASDITYIAVRGGWLYLAVVLDLYSRRVVGWHLSESLSQELTLEALKMALRLRQPKAGLIYHSDRGVQYTAAAHQELLRQHGAITSMSGKGNCWDNAVVESFFATVKKERIYRSGTQGGRRRAGLRYQNLHEARADLRDYIENWYNRRRLHSTLGYLSPIQFELRHQGKLA